jgi:uncharacterized protein
MCPSAEGHVGVVRWLLDQQANIIKDRDADGGTAQFYASERDHLPIVKLLLERGADPNIANYRGSTPLMASSSEGHLEVVCWLLGHPKDQHQQA